MASLHVCRLCLESKRKLSDIFASTSKLLISFADAASLLGQVPVDSAEDGMSKSICNDCKKLCNQFLDFRDLIQRSYNSQRRIFESNCTVTKLPNDFSTVFIKKEELEESNQEVVCEIGETSSKQEEEVFGTFFGNEKGPMIKPESFGETIVETKLNLRRRNPSLKKSEQQKNKCVKKRSRLFKHRCSDCNTLFDSEDSLKRHSIIHTEGLVVVVKDDFDKICIFCQAKFPEKLELKKHARMHVQDFKTRKVTGCKPCGKSNMTCWRTFTRHFKSHTENKTHQCNICKEVFALGNKFIEHLNLHNGLIPKKQIQKKPFLCDLCGHAAKNLSVLREHIASHSDIRVSLLSLNIDSSHNSSLT